MEIKKTFGAINSDLSIRYFLQTLQNHAQKDKPRFLVLIGWK